MSDFQKRIPKVIYFCHRHKQKRLDNCRYEKRNKTIPAEIGHVRLSNPFYILLKEDISSSVGIDGCAPFFVHAIEAANEPYFAAAIKSSCLE